MIIILIIIHSLFFLTSNAKETKITVRVKAKDVKFISSSLGASYVIIRDKNNSRFLAKGKTTKIAGL